MVWMRCRAGEAGGLVWRFQTGSRSLGWLALLLGMWLIFRRFAPPWLVPAVISTLAAWFWAQYVRLRLYPSLVAGCVLTAWAIFAWMGATSTGLPSYYLLAFLGVGFLVGYGLGPERPVWPLLPAAVLLGLATLIWILDVSIQLLPLLVPLGLILWGIWLVRQRQDHP